MVFSYHCLRGCSIELEFCLFILVVVAVVVYVCYLFALTAGPFTFPIQGDINQYGEFFINITLGSPPQTLRVQIDSGMVLFVVGKCEILIIVLGALLYTCCHGVLCLCCCYAVVLLCGVVLCRVVVM